MKLRKENKYVNILKERKKYSLYKKNFFLKKSKGIFYTNKNITKMTTKMNSICKLSGARRAVHSKINLSRHFIRWSDNHKYLESWNYK